jgi:ABC-2 type transport system ATP-binding protein
MQRYAIETHDLSRVYETYVKPEGLWGSIQGFWQRQHRTKTALHPTALRIEAGQIVGLVGANGAGKTTLLKLLSGLIHPSSGTATVLGHTPWARRNEFLRRISLLLGQKNQLWWDLTPNDSYSLLTEIYDLDRTTTQKRVRELAQILNCEAVLQTQLRRLSLGERMKMEIIGSLLHQPEVIFLDEPTIGLDIVAQTNIRQFLAEYVLQYRPTIILTSHYMDDIAKLADRLLLVSQGQIVYDGNLEGFVARSESKRIIRFHLAEPLRQRHSVGDGYFLEEQQQSFQLSVTDAELAGVLAQITTLPGISGLQIEERDFEDVIREFLEKESGVFSSGGHK